MVWKEYKVAIIIGIFIAILALVYFFAINPLVSGIKNKKTKLQELVTIQENQRRRLSEISKIKKDFEKVEASESKIQSLLEKDKAVDFIQEVEKLAEITGNEVAIEIATPESSAKASAKGSSKKNGETIISGLPVKDYVQLNIKITGSFFGFLKLLNKLENSNYYLDILSLQVSYNQNPQKPKVIDSVAKNPFARSSSDNDAEIAKQSENNQEVVSLITIAVYTRN